MLDLQPCEPEILNLVCVTVFVRLFPRQSKGTAGQASSFGISSKHFGLSSLAMGDSLVPLDTSPSPCGYLGNIFSESIGKTMYLRYLQLMGLIPAVDFGQELACPRYSQTQLTAEQSALDVQRQFALSAHKAWRKPVHGGALALQHCPTSLQQPGTV